MSQAMTQPPRAFEWKRYPETEQAVDAWLQSALDGNAFSAGLAQRMSLETGTRCADWTDHLVLADRPGLEARLEHLEFTRDWRTTYGLNATVFHHEGGLFPRVVVAPGTNSDVLELAIKVESVAEFSRAHDLGLEIQGYAMGPYRMARIPGARTSLAVVERRAYRGFEPFDGEMARAGRLSPHSARDALAARDLWHARRRRYDEDAEGFETTETLIERVVELCHDSTDLACHVIFEAERAYWQSRNRAAQVQKARQDRLGLGWANHDHHTFRCSREFFPRIIAIFKRLGFELREQFHAGAHAGWGAQVLEHPVTGIVIFADLDLTPDETKIDFAHQNLPDLAIPSTVGLWVGLHGESILEAGMHHLEAQFDFDALRDQLKAESHIETMPPFSNFPFLRQAFTEGERWPVSKHRADRLLERGWIDLSQHTRFLAEGAIGSHLENLQRREGYKGFNQQAVSAIISATDPRKQEGPRRHGPVGAL